MKALIIESSLRGRISSEGLSSSDPCLRRLRERAELVEVVVLEEIEEEC